ncbi:transmembrane protein 65 [Plakobranchus ocellatus]|uniref:Transmembrane protein 65 n=1 Tax=Plakobranchus ocellatus TaxID=259542 RepID=A0AAV4DVX6_9GAST|nr:transmembrane protein 65 [Plakobranchus ocellatus]
MPSRFKLHLSLSNPMQLMPSAIESTKPGDSLPFFRHHIFLCKGEYIDVTLGTALGISTMAAAALGNLISDVGGIGSAHYVETLAARVGVRNPHLSPEQVDMRRTKMASNLGKFIGITIGCLLGMFPLLFFDERKAEDKAKEDGESKDQGEDGKVSRRREEQGNPAEKRSQSV